MQLETEQNCNILTPTLMAITAFLSRSPGLLNRVPGGPASLGTGTLYCILSPTRLISIWLNFLCTELYNSSTSTSSCGRHKSHSFNPSTVKVIFWYSSTGCTCYLHRCISYFDSLAGVNMLLPIATATAEGLVKIWSHSVAVPPPVSFVLVGGIFKRWDSMMSVETSGIAVLL